MGKRGDQRRSQTRAQAPPTLASRRQTFAGVKLSVVAIVKTPSQLELALQQVDPTKKDMLAPVTILGTGFMVEEGVILTAAHVVAPYVRSAQRHAAGLAPPPEPLRVLVMLPSSMQPTTVRPTSEKGFALGFGFASVKSAHTSTALDLAALHVQFPSNYPLHPVTLADEPCEEGDEVVTCGFPFGRDLHRDQLAGSVVNASFSQGIVSATLPYPGAPKAVQTIFQLDAMINRGNSGGPVFDARTGRVVGVIIESHQVISVAKQPTPPPDAQPTPEPPAKQEDQLGVPTGLARAVHIHAALPLIQDLRQRILRVPKQVSQ